MATTIKCPYCAEEIQAEAIKCKHCGSWLSTEPAPPGAEVPAPAPAPPQRLMRTSRNRMLAGVCGGLARSLGIDATLLRIAFALGTFFTAIIPGIIVYLILALVIPSDDVAGAA